MGLGRTVGDAGAGDLVVRPVPEGNERACEVVRGGAGAGAHGGYGDGGKREGGGGEEERWEESDQREEAQEVAARWRWRHLVGREAARGEEGEVVVQTIVARGRRMERRTGKGGKRGGLKVGVCVSLSRFFP